MSMRLGLTSQRRQKARAVVAGLMLALWFVTSALAASPQLHHWLHQDAKAPNHQCFFTQLNKSSLLAGGGGVVVAATAPECLFLSRGPEFQFFPATDRRDSPSRAPPSVSSASLVVG